MQAQAVLGQHALRSASHAEGQSRVLVRREPMAFAGEEYLEG